jgi:hypothetical protein
MSQRQKTQSKTVENIDHSGHSGVFAERDQASFVFVYYLLVVN